MLRHIASPVRICLTSSALVGGLLFLGEEPAVAQRGEGQANASRPRLTEPGDFLPEIGSNEEFLKSLNLSEEQKTKLQEIRDDFRSVLFEFQTPEDQRKKEIKELNEEAVKLLSADQKRTWEKRKQELLAQAKAEEKENPASAGGTPAANSPQRSNSFGPAAPDGTKPVASFEIPSAEGGETFDGEPRLSFNFQYAPWTQVLELFAKAADLTLDLTDVPSGTFSYRDSRSYTPTEALDVLNGYLLHRGYLLVRRDRFLVCLNTANGIPPNLAPQISVEDLPLRGKNELVSLVIPVRGLQADEVIDEVRELLGPQGRASALKNTNSIVVTDVGSHVRRIYALLTAESSVDNRDTAFKAIPLKFISASEAERMVRRLFGLNSTGSIAAAAPAQPQQPWWMNPGGPGGFRGRSGFSGFRGRGGDNDQDQQLQPQQPTPVTTPAATGNSQFANKIQVAADNRTNHLLVSASASLIQVVEEAVQAIDTDEDGMGNKIRNFEENLSLKIYSVPTGDVESIAQTIDTMIPGVVIGQDAKLGKLHIQATADEHKEVARLIEELGGEGSSSVAVIHLQKMEPVALANTLNSLYSKEGTRAPMVEADPLGRRLIVRGTPDQIMQLRTILTGLGEGDGAPREQDRGNVRSFSLGGRDPDEILPLLKDAWSATRPNPIRISIPSRPSPIRNRSVPGADRGDTSSEDPLGDSKSKNAALIRKAKFTSESPADADDEAVTDEALEAPADAEAGADAEGSPVEQTKADGNQPPVWMQVLGDEVIITSDDPKALDKLEQLYERLLLVVPPRTKWDVFYLRSADATETAQMIEQLMPSSSVTATTRSSDGLLGSMAGGFSSLGRSVMNASGLNQTLSASQTLRIVTDARSNALFVSGPSDQVAEVKRILEVLDASELPESLRDRLPRTIAVEYADVEEVADVVESVFKDAMTPETPMMAGGARGGGGFNPLAMLMGATQNQSGRKQPGVQLTVGIDRRTNHLIVSCNDNLFQQIETLVQGIDDRAKKSRQTVRVVKLDQADPTLVQQTLGSLMPKVTVGTTRRSRRTTPADAGGTPGSQTPNSNQPNTGTPNIPVGDAAMREIFMQRMQSGQGGTGGRFGGGGNGDISNGGGRRGGGRSRSQGQ